VEAGESFSRLWDRPLHVGELLSPPTPEPYFAARESDYLADLPACGQRPAYFDLSSAVDDQRVVEVDGPAGVVRHDRDDLSDGRAGTARREIDVPVFLG